MGWGLPITWQGWVVIIAWVAILYFVSNWLVTRNQVVAFFLFVAAMVAVLALIGYAMASNDYSQRDGKPLWDSSLITPAVNAFSKAIGHVETT